MLVWKHCHTHPPSGISWPSVAVAMVAGSLEPDVFVASDVDCYASTCQLLGDVDTRPHLPAFRMPVAIVVGEEDYATPVEMARELHAAIPQSTLTIIPKARHLTPIEFPDQIAAQLRTLVQRAAVPQA